MGTLAFIVIVIFCFVIHGRLKELEKQNRDLNTRLRNLEYPGETFGNPVQNPGVLDTPVAPSPEPAIPVPQPFPKPSPQPVPVAASAAAPVVISEPAAPEPPSWSPSKSEGPKPPAPKKPTRNLEELIGGQWSVWVGGLALLVGAVLLIRFSIEAGIFGPGARIIMAFFLGCLLLAAGEWLKRSDDRVLKGKLGEAKKALQANASVPGLLSAIGIFTLLGTTYAAHELYGFISAPVAFIGLGVIALGAMALSLRQGPILAVIGLLASMVTPLLIQTDTPNFVALVGYLLIIGFAALLLARRTGWRWLETGTVFGWLFWLFMSIAAATGGQLPLWGLFLAIGFSVTVWLAEQDPEEKRTDAAQHTGAVAEFDPHPILAVLWSAIGAGLVGYVAAMSHEGINGIAFPEIALAVLSITSLCGAALLMRRQTGHLIIAGLLAMALAAFQAPASQLIIFGIATAVVVVLSIREANSRAAAERLSELGFDPEPESERTRPDLLWAGFAIFLGLGGVFLSSIIPPTGWPETIFAVWALVYAALFAATAIGFQIKSRPHLTIIVFTLGAAAAWILSSLYAFDGLYLSLAFSAGAAIMAAAIWQLRLPGARLAVLGLTGLVFAHAVLIQFPVIENVSARPIFNALWAYIALPTAILGTAGYVLHGRREESKTGQFLNGIIEAAALAGLALFAVFQIRHLSNGGAIYINKVGFPELGLQVSIGLCFTLAGLSKRFAGNLVLSKMAEVISYVTLFIFALGSLLFLSPLFNPSEFVKGNFFFNALTTGLLVPTVLLAICGLRARGRRPDQYVNVLGGLALAGGISWVTAMIRYLYNGSTISIFRVNFGDLELWTISVVWLAIGIALLALGVWRKTRALRIASGVVIILTVLKAFLIDMAGLEGVLRALSFVALGIILIVIGRAYQRYWLSGSTQEKTEETA